MRWLRHDVGDRSVQDRGRPWVSRVGMPRSRSRFSTVVGSTRRCSPTRASDQPESYRRIASSTWLGDRPRWRMSTSCRRRMALTVRRSRLNWAPSYVLVRPHRGYGYSLMACIV